jgi:hypothetical protein
MIPSSPSQTSSSRDSTSTSILLQSSLGSSQYPLVWGPNPLTVCYADQDSFCVSATLGFSSNAASFSDISTPVTPNTENNETTIVRGITTTLITGNHTSSSNWVDLTAFVQDAVTGQNASHTAVAAWSCVIPPAGFTDCQILAINQPAVPAGHAYEVTVIVSGPSHLPDAVPQSWPRLAAPETMIVPAGTWGTTSPPPTTVDMEVNAVESPSNATLVLGIPVTLYSSDGAVLQRGVTTATFSVTIGQTYEVGVANSGNCTFVQWADGSSNPRTFTPNLPVDFTAVVAFSTKMGGGG